MGSHDGWILGSSSDITRRIKVSLQSDGLLLTALNRILTFLFRFGGHRSVPTVLQHQLYTFETIFMLLFLSIVFGAVSISLVLYATIVLVVTISVFVVLLSALISSTRQSGSRKKYPSSFW